MPYREGGGNVAFCPLKKFRLAPRHDFWRKKNTMLSLDTVLGENILQMPLDIFCCPLESRCLYASSSVFSDADFVIKTISAGLEEFRQSLWGAHCAMLRCFEPFSSPRMKQNFERKLKTKSPRERAYTLKL